MMCRGVSRGSCGVAYIYLAASHGLESGFMLGGSYPAQQASSTAIGISGKAALSSRNYCAGFGAAEGSVNEILLHINNYKDLFSYLYPISFLFSSVKLCRTVSVPADVFISFCYITAYHSSEIGRKNRHVHDRFLHFLESA